MDYLEGFLIGPIWSDTEYQTRRHVMVHLVLAVLVTVLYIGLLFMPTIRPVFFFIPLRPSAVLFALLFFITPFISSFYYRIPAFLRPFLLLIYISKYVIAFITLLQLVVPLYQPHLVELTDMALERINGRIDLTTSWFSGLGPMFSMVAGIVAGGLWLVGETLLIIFGLIAVPLLLIAAIKGLRYVMDLLIVKVFFSDLRQRR